MNFTDMMATLGNMGFMDVVLPFMLIFAVIYFTLTTVLKEMFGKKDENNDNSKYAIVVAFVIALGVIIPHVTKSYPPGMDVVNIINSALPSVVVVAIAILGLMVLLGMFNIKILEWGGKTITPVIVIAAIGIIVYIFVGASGKAWRMPNWIRTLFGSDTITLVITLLVFGLIVWFITKPKKSAQEKNEGRFKGLKELDKIFKE